MIGPVVDFVSEFTKDKYFKKVLEVGSRDVNGSVKHLFKCDEYIGLDLIAGPNVDIVADALRLPEYFKDKTFDCVLCVETLEHVKDPWTIVKNMRSVLKKGGWMLITTPCIGHPEHNWPSDYYRYFESTYKDVFFEGFEEREIRTLIWDSPGIVIPNTQYPHAVLGYGKKPS